MPGNTLLSIIIPTHNNHAELKALLHSIKKSHFDHFDNTEIIVIDDGSTDSEISRLQLEMTMQVQMYVLKQNRGPAYARNYGASRALGRYLVFLDADVTLHKDTLQHAYNFFQQKKGLAFTGIWDRSQKSNAFFPQYKALRDHAYWFIEREKDARYYLFSTRIAGIEKNLFEKIGGFNTSYKKPTVEDIELTYKIEQHCPISFEPDISVHHEFEDFWPVAKKYFARSRDWIKLYLKRLRFDPVATSSREAYKSIAVGFAQLCIILILITDKNIFFMYSLLFIFYYLLLDAPFIRFIQKEKGAVFMFKSVVTSFVLYTIINIGSVVGLTEYFFTKK